MRLHQAGKVTNRQGHLRRRLGRHLRRRHPRALRLAAREPRGGVPPRRPRELARGHRPQPRAWSRSTPPWPSTSRARSIADTIDAVQYSGIGGHEDFVSGPALELEDRSLLCLPSTITVGDELRSRIVPWFEAGAVITTPRHQVDVIVTEHGAAELQGKTVHQRGEALAAIAHPAFREGLREAAARAQRRPGPPFHLRLTPPDYGGGHGRRRARDRPDPHHRRRWARPRHDRPPGRRQLAHRRDARPPRRHVRRAVGHAGRPRRRPHRRRRAPLLHRCGAGRGPEARAAPARRCTRPGPRRRRPHDPPRAGSGWWRRSSTARSR